MSFRHQVIFWLLVLVVLTFLFAGTSGGLSESFYFVCTVMPVAIGTSWYFNDILVERFLFKRRYGKLILNFLYSMIISLWAQVIIILLALVVLAELRMDNLTSEIANIRLLALVVYGIVFIQAFINMFIKFQRASETVEALQTEQEKRERGKLTIRANRKSHQIYFEEIIYVESLSDYIRIIRSDQEPLTTRLTISNIEKQLPDNFIRIHRSFIIRMESLESFNKEEVTIAGKTLPIGRKYKEGFLQQVEK